MPGPSPTLTVTEADGAPLVAGINKIKFSNGSVTDDGGGVVSVTTGGGSAITSINGDTTAAQTITVDSTLDITNAGATHTIKAKGTGTATILLASQSVNLNDATHAKQTLYTCPASRRCLIENILIHNLTGSSFDTARLSIGWGVNADSVAPIFPIHNLFDNDQTGVANLNQADPTTGLPVLIMPMEVGTAGGVLGLKNTIVQGSALTAIVDVYGYLTDTSGVPVANVLTLG